ncbi:hypothetical protein NE237_008411 [Protea cynaroides]|uniref:RNase H type-1 domain-containing protein n=1 Tax=Protea cynaroides TaxID=273540 RepID=A0A9Q0KWM8_9MAGN|nr:hypothetical protein NE237_008411 [Protea cynaroides]
MQLVWRAPIGPCLKLNADGCSLGNPGFSGAGRVFRDSSGTVRLAYAVFIDITSHFRAEFFVVLLGVRLAINLGVSHLWIESDTSVVVKCFLSLRIPWFGMQLWNSLAILVSYMDWVLGIVSEKKIW